MEENQGYVIRQSVLFDNGRGFAMGENFKAPNPFVTWQFTQEDGKRDYYWGHYFNEECEAIGITTAVYSAMKSSMAFPGWKPPARIFSSITLPSGPWI